MKNFYTLIALFFITPIIAQDLVINVVAPPGTTSCRIGGPWWGGWDPNAGPVGVDQGNGSFKFTFSPAPGADMEYKFVIDGVYEDILDNATNGDCTDRAGNNNINTDYFSYANRIWKTTDTPIWNEVAGTCEYYVLSTNEFDLLKFSLVPNPTTNIVKVSSVEIGTKLSVYDLEGRLVINKKINNTSEEVRVNHLNSGMYIARLQLGNKTATKKLVIN